MPLSCGLQRRSSGPSHRQKDVAERHWSCVADPGLILATDHCDSAAPSCLLITVSVDHPLRDPLTARPEMKVWLVNAVRIEPSRLSRRVAVMPLLDVASPTVVQIGSLPSQMAPGRRQSEMLPCPTVRRMLQYTTKTANSGQGMRETAIIVAQPILMRLSGRSMVEPAPALAGGVSYHRMWPHILARITRLIPWIDIGQSEIASVRFDIESGDCHNWPASLSRDMGSMRN